MFLPITRRSMRVAVSALALLLAAACDPRFVRESDLNSREIQNLSGVWQGQASLSFTTIGTGAKLDSPCPRVYLWTLRVNAGNVEGEVVNKDTPNAPRTRFTTFLDFDGSIHAFIRPDGRDSNILGSFQRKSFGGQSKGTECSYVIRLERQGTS
jgi:hypothetical protein